jgi:hypothetical protein
MVLVLLGSGGVLFAVLDRAGHGAPARPPDPSASCLPGALCGLGVANGTTLVVTLVVNGTWQRAYGPHDGGEVQARDLPPLPWDVEARTPSGRVLASMTVREGDVSAPPDGYGEHRGEALRVDLSCGRLDIWCGFPLAGPPPGPGLPGDCLP